MPFLFINMFIYICSDAQLSYGAGLELPNHRRDTKCRQCRLLVSLVSKFGISKFQHYVFRTVVKHNMNFFYLESSNSIIK